MQQQDPNRSTLIFKIASVAMTIERSSRHLYLQQVCESDLELRATVEELLNEAEAGSADGSFTLRAPWGPVDLWADENAFAGTDRYQVRKRLGSGAFGTVYEAWDAQEQQRVAVKVLQQRKPAFLLRFKREFRSLANLKGHPNIVRLHELHGDEKHWFYTMELVEGQSFLSYVRPGGVRNDERLRKSLYQLWAGVRFLHERRQLHRDLKPANVMVSTASGEDSGRVVILDFGLVKELGDVGIEQSVAIAGSPAYMAPEQGEKGVLSEGTDWYAVGVMLYQALTGSLPFSGSLFEVLLRKRQNEAPDVRELDPSIDADLSDICRKLLSRDLDQRLAGAADLEGVWKPDATRAVAAPSSKGSDEIFVGRSEERRALEESLQAVLSGRQAVVGVVGPSGIGKSALVRQFLKDAKEQAPDSLVLTGRCYEAESVPFKTLDAVIDELSQHLQGLDREEMASILPRESHLVPKVFPVMGEVKAIRDSAGMRVQAAAIPDAQEVRQRAFVAMRELLGRLADRRPVVVWVDDLQWGDLDSLAFVEEVVCGARAPSMLWVFSYRQEDRDTSPVLQALRERITCVGHWSELRLQELAREESRILAGRLLRDAGPSGAVDLDRLIAESGGSPLFLQELVRSAGTGVDGLDFKQVILRRIRQLPVEIHDVMAVAALAGQNLETSEIVQVLGGLKPALHQTAVQRCVEEKLLRSAGSRGRGLVEPYHDQIREAVAGSLDPDTKRELHGRLANVLERRPGIDAERLVPHYVGAGNDKAAYQKALEAAQQAEKLTAFDKAATLYQFAMTRIAPAGADSQEILALHTSLGKALALAGRGKQSAEAYSAAAELAPTQIARLRLKLDQCTQLLRGGYIDEGLEVLRALSSSFGRPIPESRNALLAAILVLRARLWLRSTLRRVPDSAPSEIDSLFCDFCCAAACCLCAVDILLSGYLILQLHEMRSRFKLTKRQSTLALVYEGVMLGGDGPHAHLQANRLLNQAVGLAKASDDPFALGMAQLSQAMVAYMSGHLEEIVRLSNLAEQTFRTQCSGVVWEISSCQVLRLYALSWLGRVDEFPDGWRAMAQEAQLRNDKFTSVSLKVLTYSHFPQLCRDGPEESTQSVLQAYAAWTRNTFDLQRYGVICQVVESLIYSAKGPEAWDRLISEWPEYRKSQLHRWKILDMMYLVLRGRTALAAIGAGRDGLHKDLRRTVRDLRRLGFEGGDAAALAFEGMALADRDRERAASLVLSAAQGFASAGWGLYEIAAKWRHAECEGTLQTIRPGLEAAMASRGISNPEKIVNMLLPSPWRPA